MKFITAKEASALSRKDNILIFNRIMRSIKRASKHHKNHVDFDDDSLFDFHRVDYILSHQKDFCDHGYEIEIAHGYYSSTVYVTISW